MTSETLGMGVRILVATTRQDQLAVFLEELGHSCGELVVLDTGEETLAAARANAPDLVIIDVGLPDFKPLDLVHEVMKINAMVNTAVFTDLDQEAFHEASEGWGVLMGLAMAPAPGDGDKLLERLASVTG
ncbi:MAG: response regulator [Desulfovibrio sp.]|nr:MAG: response regulator [Desulfovibrio sp.]